MPPGFPKRFYTTLRDYAQEFGLTRVQFAMQALRHYARELRTRNSPIAKALDSPELAKKFTEARSKIAKGWWAKLSPEERKVRAERANRARWPKKREGK